MKGFQKGILLFILAQLATMNGDTMTATVATYCGVAIMVAGPLGWVIGAFWALLLKAGESK